MGVPSSTLKGSDQLSYCAARIRKTNSKREAEDAEGGTPCAACCSWNDMPGVVEAHFARHGLREDFLERVHGLAGAVAGRGGGVDLRRVVFVVAHGEFRARRWARMLVTALSGTISPRLLAT